MEKSRVNSPSERLGMLDEHGHRQFIIPAEVRGFYHNWKKRVHFVLMVVFLALPWICIGGHQAILLDIPNRQFFFFGLHLMAYDAPLIFFLLAIATIGLALMTALFGRVWCGWACPQTVFIESVYRNIERWTEGNYIERRKLQKEDWSFRKFRKTGLKWVLFLMVSSLIAHSAIAYWTGSHELLEMMQRPPSQNWTYFLMVTSMTLLLAFNFGWFREQFCLIMCPYGKFQSVLMDSQSVTVMYDAKRGEPRKGQILEGQPKGDCVSCNRCVQVCPTGIDIRNGLQMECIACTACIDACDDIMTKVKKPTGLIRYKALTDGPVRWLRPRVVAYSALVLAALIALVALLALHKPVRVEILRAKNIPYIVSPEGTVRNQFILKFENHSTVRARLKIVSSAAVNFVIPQNPLTLDPEAKQEIPIFIEAAQNQFQFGKLPVEIKIQNESDENRVISSKTVTILGPFSQGGTDGK